MGDNFLEAQVKNTKKRRARAAAIINSPKLIVRPDEVVDEFTVECRDGFELSPGEVLRCFPGESSSAVEVARGHLNVGEVTQSGGGRVLKSEIQAEGVGRLRICTFDQLAGSAQVECFREDTTNGD